MARVGFEVSEWVNKAFSEFTDEELLEYWYKLRTTTKSGEIIIGKDDMSDISTRLYVANLQEEILGRMNKK